MPALWHISLMLITIIENLHFVNHWVIEILKPLRLSRTNSLLWTLVWSFLFSVSALWKPFSPHKQSCSSEASAVWTVFLLAVVFQSRRLLAFLCQLWLKLGDGWVISLPVGFCCTLNCVFVPINLIKRLIAFANHPASSCCCLLLSLISEITGPPLKLRASDNGTVGVDVCEATCSGLV